MATLRTSQSSLLYCVQPFCAYNPLKFMDDPKLKPLEDDDYIAFGLACCFVMNDNLKLDGEFLSFVPSSHQIIDRVVNPVGPEVVAGKRF